MRWGSPPGSSPRSKPLPLDFLHEPDVAVGTGEVEERRVAPPFGIDAVGAAARSEVVGITRCDAALDELRMRSLDVRDAQVEALERAGLHLADSGPDRDRARGAGRRHLHDPEVLPRARVDLEAEAELVEVERFRTVDVRNGPDHQFERPIHGA